MYRGLHRSFFSSKYQLRSFGLIISITTLPLWCSEPRKDEREPRVPAPPSQRRRLRSGRHGHRDSHRQARICRLGEQTFAALRMIRSGRSL